MIMFVCHRHSTPWLALLWLVGASGGVQAAAALGAADGNSPLPAAQAALQRGDCGVASTRYRQAAQKSAQAELAAQATAVALACGQSTEARLAAQRWLQLAPGDSSAGMAQVRAELAGYRIAEARALFQSWLGAGDRKVSEAIDALAQSAGTEPTYAMLRELQHPALKEAAVQRALAALALDAWDASGALRFAQGARSAGAAAKGSAKELAELTARAQAILGNESAALSAAHEAGSDQGARLSAAEVQLLLGKTEQGQSALDGLRSDPEVGPAARRQLAQLAFEQGEYAVAEQRCTALLHEPQSAPVAVYLLGMINERRGDEATALRNYQLLLGSGFDAQGKRRAAAILYRQGERAAALRLFEPPRGAEPGERIHADIEAADLLSLVDAPEEALARIDGALRRSPGNAELDYQRGVLLERSGKLDAALSLLESLHRARPLDAAITNALGFTLADHRRALPRAEQLIRAALQAQPDSPAILDSLGWVLYRRGQPKAAVPVLARAYRLLHDGDIGAHWGEALWADGQQAAARGAWQRALAADPDNTRLAATAKRFIPGLAAPKPPPALEAAPRTSI